MVAIAQETFATLYERLGPVFAEAAESVVPLMAGVPVKAGHWAIKPSGDRHQYDVSGIVGFSGQIIGSLVISFPLAVAQSLVAGLSGGVCPPTDSSDFADAVGELANMIGGAAKSKFGQAASMTVPVVIVGTGHRVPGLSDVPIAAIPCVCAAGTFVLEINLKHRVNV